MTVLVITISLLPASATPDGLSGDAETGETVKTSENAEKQYFNVSNFRGTETHNFSVHRNIIIRRYGGVFINTSFFLKVAEDADDSFNAVNFTILNEEFDSIFRYTINHLNGSTSGFSVTEDRQENSTILSVGIPSVSSDNEIAFSFIAHYGTFVKQNPTELSQLVFNGVFNHSFYPWISVPLAAFSLQVLIEGDWGEDKSRVIEASIEPNGIPHGNITETPADSSPKLEFSNVTILPNLNVSLLDDSLGYNLTTLEDIDFIPAYDSRIGENLSLFLSFNYTNNFPPIQYDYYHRTVEINQWKSIKVTEEIQIRNLVGNTSQFALVGRAGYFILPIPSSYEYLTGFDSFGNLTVNHDGSPVGYGEDLTVWELQILPRTSIYGNETYKFTISYIKDLDDVLDGDLIGTQHLKIWSSSWFNWTITDFKLKVILPFGSSYKSISGFPQELLTRSKGTTGSSLFNLMQRPYQEWTVANATGLGMIEITITYDVGFLWIISSPLIYGLSFLLIGLLYIGMRSIRFGDDFIGEIEEIPLELIEGFVKIYEEKTAIRERLQRLERQRRSGKATDREYQKARRILQNKLTAIERELVGSTRSLAKKGRIYDGFTHSIEVAEAEREDVLANLARLEKRKTAGRIGKEAYHKLKGTYERQLRKANNSLDRVLIELRSLLPE